MDKDRAKRVAEEINSNPLLAAAVYGLGGAVLGLGWATMNSTPEKRRQFKEMQAQYRRDRARRDRESRQSELRYALRKSYFEEGPGKDLYQDRAYIVIPAGPPFADAIFTERSGSFGSRGFTAESRSAGVLLSASDSPYDGRGALHLVRPDGSELRGYANLGNDDLRISAEGELEPWLRDAELMARLISAPGSFCRFIRLTRPDAVQIREAIWQEYLRANPHIASAVGEN